ncbi:hypothetical protein [Frankia sp. KB5]|uniref:hypothetical protein n=1 Tax=Frankia sp. KB5 TaxID=683318 RepID=UPI000A21502F|nr:hypothetical protein [Frankia sp. KB5]ORT49035.1 hypothetical protein KBI5_14805 [Frankia sp. KB5]
MDPVSMIIGALLAGAGAGVTESAQSAVTGAYAALRERLVGFLSREGRRDAVDRFEEDPAGEEERFRAELSASAAREDAEVLAAARRVWELVDPAAAAAGRFQVDLRDAKGVQVGDGNVQINRF